MASPMFAAPPGQLMTGCSAKTSAIGFEERPPASKEVGTAAFARGRQGLQFVAFDDSYLERLRRGDSETEGHFVSYFSELIRLKLRSRLNSKEAIEDVRQETFVRVFSLIRSEGRLRQSDRLGACVNSVCNNVLLEHYRSRSRAESTLSNDADNVFVAPEPSAHRVLEENETKRMVQQILNQLTEKDRRLLQSVLLDERDKDEVCEEFGIKRDYLRVLVHRAKQSFKSSYLKRLAVTRTC